MQESLARWLRIRATEEDLSVSRFVASLLAREMRHSGDYEQAQQRALSRLPRALRAGAHDTTSTYPKRDEIYDRPIFRR